MLKTIGKYCSFLNTNDRNPSKNSVLTAAAKECVLLKRYEQTLTSDKADLIKTNKELKEKLKILTCQTGGDSIENVQN